MKRVSFVRPRSRERAERILALLAERPRTAAELGKALGVTKRWVRPYLDRMREQRRVYIQSWVSEEVAGMKAYLREVWAFGEHEDAPRPRVLTDAEYQRASRARKKDVERLAQERMEAALAKRLGPRRDVAASWF